jgi:hypothetical protein
MRGGGVFDSEKKDIMKLLSNVMINNFELKTKEELCSLDESQRNKKINEIFNQAYSTLFQPNDSRPIYKYEDILPEKKSILDELEKRGKHFFKPWVKNSSEVVLLSPEQFNEQFNKKSLTSKYYVTDQLVHSMIALAVKSLRYKGTFEKPVINLDDPICPRTAIT